MFDMWYCCQFLTEIARRGGNHMPGWFWWIVIGIAAGWLAGQVMKGSGYGLLGDLIIGALGGLIGGWVFGLLGIKGTGLLGALITAVIGAILLIVVVRALRGGGRRR
jgi:uncharacterized membrane protein YeaQ/YmgE (transglycosylase-associated protein family)